MDCELRLFTPATQPLNDDVVIHVHGRFSVVSTPDEDEPHLKIEVHRFIVMNAVDPMSATTPDELLTSVTLLGRAVPIPDAANETPDRYFQLEVKDYIRDHNQTFSIRFATFLFLFSDTY